MTEVSRKLLSLFGFLSLAAIAFPAGAACTDDTSSLRDYFKVEGNDAIDNGRNGTLSFSATRSKFQSGHGHGWRNEAKIRKGLRLPVGETKEHFSATVMPNLPSWAKTIVAQYHFKGLDTAMKVYVQDTKDGGGLDGKEGNGIFDILVRMTGQSGKENAYPLGTVKSGEPFDLDISFNGGTVNVTVSTQKWGRKETGNVTLPDSPDVIYFKFGDYLQAANTPGQYTTNENDWKAYYSAHHIDNTEINFSHVHFSRG